MTDRSPHHTTSAVPGLLSGPACGALALCVLLPVMVFCSGCGRTQFDEFVEYSSLETGAVGGTELPADVAIPSDPLAEIAVAAESGEVRSVADWDASDTLISRSGGESGNVVSGELKNEDASSPMVADDADKSGDCLTDSVVADSGAAETEDGSPPEPLAVQQRPIELLVPHRHFRKQGAALRVSFDDIDLLKILNMDPVPTNADDYFPDWLHRLNGQRVRIRGYMRPGFEAEDLTQFLFVRDNGECCYGPRPKIYDMIAVELVDGEMTDWIKDLPFDVEGTFRIDPFADEVELMGLFFIDDGTIIR